MGRRSRKVRERRGISDAIFSRIRSYLMKRCLAAAQFLRSKIAIDSCHGGGGKKAEEFSARIENDLEVLEANNAAIEELRRLLEDKMPGAAISSPRTNTPTSDVQSYVDTLNALLREISDVDKGSARLDNLDCQADSDKRNEIDHASENHDGLNSNGLEKRNRIRPKAAKGERSDIVIHDYIIIDENAVLDTEQRALKRKRPNAAKGKRKVEDQLDLPAHLLVSTLGGCSVRSDRPQAARKERKHNVSPQAEKPFQTHKVRANGRHGGFIIEVKEACETERMAGIDVTSNVNQKGCAFARGKKVVGDVAGRRRPHMWDDIVVEDLDEVQDLGV